MAANALRPLVNDILPFLAVLVVSVAIPRPASAAENPRELGQVSWLRDWDTAAARSRVDGRPLLVLFQEIPGCATCVGFGEGALSNPRLVEASKHSSCRWQSTTTWHY